MIETVKAYKSLLTGKIYSSEKEAVEAEKAISTETLIDAFKNISDSYAKEMCELDAKYEPLLDKIESELESRGVDVTALEIEEFDEQDAEVKKFIEEKFPDFANLIGVIFGGTIDG